jgi:hypothetical protein
VDLYLLWGAAWFALKTQRWLSTEVPAGRSVVGAWTSAVGRPHVSQCSCDLDMPWSPVRERGWATIPRCRGRDVFFLQRPPDHGTEMYWRPLAKQMWQGVYD